MLIFFAGSLGATEPPVREVQKRLKALGFYHGEIDGVAGSRTAAAIRRYQLAHNLRVTGEMNPQTALHMGFGEMADKEMEAFFSGGPLAQASAAERAQTLRRVQAFLAKEGLPVGEVDGRLGPQTRAALIEWQRRAGIPFRGRLDAATLARMGLLRSGGR